MSILSEKTNILCLHSNEDKELIERLKKHLLSTIKNIDFKTINDDNLETDQNIIQKKLESIHIFLIAVSVNFISSKINTSLEMAQVMTQHEERKSRVIPVILSSCNWFSFPYAVLQSVPPKPITDKYWSSIDDAIAKVVHGIGLVIKK